jgi:hypothetical protein
MAYLVNMTARLLSLLSHAFLDYFPDISHALRFFSRQKEGI